MKNKIMKAVVVLSFLGFTTLSFAGLSTPLEPGEVRKTGRSIYKKQRTQTIAPKPAPVARPEVKANEKMYEEIDQRGDRKVMPEPSGISASEVKAYEAQRAQRAVSKPAPVSKQETKQTPR